MSQSKPLRIYIEGNIGSGKTTFCKYLQEYFKDKNIGIALEPLDRWLDTKDKDGFNILDLYYKDSAKYSFVFQMTTFIISFSLAFTALLASQDFEVSRQPTRFYSEIFTVNNDK